MTLAAVLAASSPEYDRGVAALRAGRPAEALTHLEAARLKAPNDIEVLYSLATCYFALGRSEDALTSARAIVSKNAADPAVLLAVASLLLNNKLGGEAEGLLVRADSLNPGNPMVLAWLARTQAGYGKPDAAVDSLRLLLSTLRSTAAPETRAAVEHAFDTAAALSKQDQASVPRAVTAGELALRLNREAQAFEILQPLRTAGWTNPEYCHLLALVCARTNRLTEAAAAAEQAVKLAPQRQEFVLNLAAVHQAARDNPSAILVLQRAVASGTTSAEIHFALALSQFNMSAWTKALTSCDRALALNPAFERALQLKGRCYGRMAKPQEAASAFRAALKLNSACDYCRIELASALVSLGKVEEAESLLSEVARRSPSNAAVQYDLGKLLADRGNTAGAIASLEAAVRADRNHDSAWYLLGRMYAKNSEATKSAEAFATARRLKEERRSAAERRLSSIPEPQ
jgi:Flp pilus assembly protein TadD